MDRDRRYRRYQRRSHIKRKKRLLKHIKNLCKPKCLGELSKGKIHCSCLHCSAKYRLSPSISDMKKLNHIHSSPEMINFQNNLYKQGGLEKLQEYDEKGDV